MSGEYSNCNQLIAIIGTVTIGLVNREASRIAAHAGLMQRSASAASLITFALFTITRYIIKNNITNCFKKL